MAKADNINEEVTDNNNIMMGLASHASRLVISWTL